MKKGSLLLAGLALMAYWPVLDAHPLMDDHLFFAWLEQTPWQTALWQRFTGNWIPYFNQMQMYRPVSGAVQVLTYNLFGAHPLPHHLFSLLLHALTSLLAGILAFRLSQDSRAGWCTAGILLLHPRAALGVSLIFNFYDPLASCLMLGALLCLWSLKQDDDRRGGPLSLAALWLCIGLALGAKELALPIVAVLILADWFWQGRLHAARVACSPCSSGLAAGGLSVGPNESRRASIPNAWPSIGVPFAGQCGSLGVLLGFFAAGVLRCFCGVFEVGVEADRLPAKRSTLDGPLDRLHVSASGPFLQSGDAAPLVL